MKNSYTVKELHTMLVDEVNTLYTRDIDASNKANAIKKMTILDDILYTLPNDMTLDNIEGCRGDGEIRANTLVNVGSVIEAVVRYYMGKSACKTESGRDCGRYEVKCSLTSKSLCTAPQEATATIVVNELGVWLCYKKDFAKYLTAKNGTKFPHNRACGKYMVELSEKMGFEPLEC